MLPVLQFMSVLVTILLAGCESVVQTNIEHPTVRVSTDTTDAAYFGAFRTWGDSVWLAFNAATLRGMGEPPLRGAMLDASVRVMRFTWQRSFYPYVAVRVTQSRAGCSVVTTVRTPFRYLSLPLDHIRASAATEPAPEVTIRRDSTAVAAAVCADLFAHLESIGVTADRRLQLGAPDTRLKAE